MCVREHFCGSVFVCSVCHAASRLSSVCLRLRLCPKASVYTLDYRGTEGGKKTQKEKRSDDGNCRRIYLESLRCDGITMVQILLTFILTSSVASANIMSLQQAPKESITSLLPTTSTLLPHSPPIAFPPLQPCSAPVCPSL